MKSRTLVIAGALALGIGGLAIAQAIVVPQVTSINPGDLFQDIVNGRPQAGNFYASALQLGNYAATQPGNNSENDLIGGDFGYNLYQDGTSVSSITTATTYVADQWAAFSGTSTTLGGAQETGAADIPLGYLASERITRSGSGVVQSCVAQIVAVDNVVRYQGQTAEFDFHALAGSGFSAAGSNLSVLFVTGTGSGDTMVNLGKTINSALTGTAWAGAATSTVPVPISTVWGRYTAVAPIPATATELAVALCWTPVGASPSSDYFEFTGAQLTPNSSLASVAGTAGAALAVNDTRAKSFARRPQAQETNLQLAYYWRQNEPASSNQIYGVCQGLASTTAANCLMTFPVPMVKIPTFAFTAGTLQATANTAGAAAAVTGLVINTTVGASTYQANLTATVTSAATITGFLEAGNSTGGGKLAFSARF
jgi:hypothetical protein